MEITTIVWMFVIGISVAMCGPLQWKYRVTIAGPPGKPKLKNV